MRGRVDVLVRNYSSVTAGFSFIVGLLTLASSLGYVYYTTIHRVTLPVKVLYSPCILYASIASSIITTIILYFLGKEGRVLLTLPMLTLAILTLKHSLQASALFLEATSLILMLANCRLFSTSLLTQLLQGTLLIELLAIPYIVFIILGIHSQVLEQYYFLERSLWGLLGWLSPLLLLILLYWWVGKPVLKWYMEVIARHAPWILPILSRITGLVKQKLHDGVRVCVSTSRRVKLLVLTLASSLSIVIYIIPYLPSINPSGTPSTVDWIYYYKWLEKMDSEGFMWAYSHRGDRFLYLWILYGFQKLLHLSIRSVAVYHNILWSLVLTLSVYILAGSLYDSRTALYAALLTPLSHQALAFLYGGFQSNQLTLALVLLAMALQIKCFRGNCSRRGFICLCILLLVTPLMHSWTWIHIAPALFLYSLVVLLKSHDRMLKRYSLATIAVLVSLFLTRQLLGGWVMQPLHFVEASIHSREGLRGLVGAFSYYLWGSLNIPALYAAAVWGMWVEEEPLLNSLLLLCLATSLVLPFSSMTEIARLTINIPLQIMAARAICTSNNKIVATTLLIIMLINAMSYSIQSIPLTR